MLKRWIRVTDLALSARNLGFFLCLGLLKVSLYEFKTFARGVCYQHGFLIFRHLFYSKYFLVGCQTIGSHFSDFMIFLLRYTLSFSWPNNLPFSNTWNHWLKIFENKYSEKEKIVRGSAPHFSKGVFLCKLFHILHSFASFTKGPKIILWFQTFFFVNIFFFFFF